MLVNLAVMSVATLTLDVKIVKNAFNRAPMVLILKEVGKRKIDDSLVRVIACYLIERYYRK